MSRDNEGQSVRASLRILLIGASGNFGRRLARLLRAEEGVDLTLAGRNQSKLDEISGELGGVQTVRLDRNSLHGDQLSALQTDIVIDAAGPYDLANTAVIDAAITAKAHYIDLADNREFVAGISRFDDDARKAGVAIISGASSTPALSDAAVRHLTDGWQSIDRIKIAISPSNRQPRGLSVVQSILTNVGQPFSVFRDGHWREEHGWGHFNRADFPEVGRRWISPIATPDQDLMVENHRPRLSAEFYASLELSIMHLGLWLLHFLARWRMMKSLKPMAKLLKWLSDWLEPFGNDLGGMTVDVAGVNANGNAVTAKWWLAAKGDIGPNVPILAALNCVRGIRDDRLPWHGARSCTGFLKLAEFEPDFARLGMETGAEVCTKPPDNLFQIALAADYAKLPQVTQAIHQINSTNIWSGYGQVDGGNNFVARLISRLFGFPKPVKDAQVTVIIERNMDSAENWSRIWPSNIMRSVMKNPDAQNSTIEECFGPFAFTLKLDGHSEGIDMHLQKVRLLGMPLPRFILPRIEASERAEANRHLFDVNLSLPLIGQLVHYQGWLANEH